MSNLIDKVMDWVTTPWYKHQQAKIDALTHDLEYYKDQVRKIMRQYKELKDNEKALYDENCKLTSHNSSLKMQADEMAACANKYQLQYNSAIEAAKILEQKLADESEVCANQIETINKWKEDYKCKSEQFDIAVSECNKLHDEVADLQSKLEKKNFYKMMAKLSANKRTIDKLLCKISKYEAKDN